MACRVRDAARTKGQILEAARDQFSRHGYGPVTIRSVATTAGVDPALILHYFGHKAGLFAEASHLKDVADAQVPSCEASLHDLADLIAHRISALCGDRGFLALLRTAGADPSTAAALRAVVLDRLEPILKSQHVDDALHRQTQVACQALGLVLARSVLGLEPLAAMTPEQLGGWLTPQVAVLLS